MGRRQREKEEFQTGRNKRVRKALSILGYFIFVVLLLATAVAFLDGSKQTVESRRYMLMGTRQSAVSDENIITDEGPRQFSAGERFTQVSTTSTGFTETRFIPLY
ncbi:MAG: hypothetical protein AMXMBFR44_6420 [Candidatus Campbellbacteria bacterium]